MAKYFSEREFACHHCWQLPKGGLEPNLIRILDEARERAGVPIIVSSGYRCLEHNRAIGGAAQSYHMRGMAADVYSNDISSDELHEVIYKVMQGLGIKGGHQYYPPGRGDFVHVDTRGEWVEGWI